MKPGDGWTHAPEAWAEIWKKKKQGVEFLRLKGKVEIQIWVRPDDFVRYGRRALVGLRADDVKAVSIERLCVSLSSCRKTFKLKKVNKSFVPEPISCFRIPIYVYEHFMNIMSISHIRIMGMLHYVYFTYPYHGHVTLCLFHISVSWVRYIMSISHIRIMGMLHLVQILGQQGITYNYISWISILQ